MATEQVENQGDAELSLRDQLDAAFTEADGADETPAAAESKPAVEETQADRDRARDERGRFAAKAAEVAADKAATGAPEGAAAAAGAQAAPVVPAVPGAAPGPSELKPPASWRPEVREKWGNVDPVVREEIHRREFELQRVMQNGAQARQFLDAFERVVAPYEVFIRQENSSPLQAVQNMMQTAADLRVGTPQHKATLIASLVKNFGVDVGMLDAALVGAAPPPGSAQDFRDPRLDQFLNAQQQMLHQTRQREEADLQATLKTFAEKHEFYKDVAGLMADLVEIRGRRGEVPDIEKIYAEACKMNESVSTILAQRAASAKSGQQSAAVLRAKRAAVSVKGDASPGGATVPENDSVRAALVAAMESSGRA
jgi:hypothetical protein